MDGIVPPIPMPLPVIDDFTVTSANAGAANATSATKTTKRFMRFISILFLLRRVGARLGPLVGPIEHFGHDVEHGLARGVAMRFEGQRDVANRCAVAFQRAIETL